MMTRYLLVAFVLAIALLFNPGTALADTVVLEGKMGIWTARPCEDGIGLCTLPKLIGAPWSVRIEYEKPAGLGLFLVADQRYTAEGYNIRLMQLWRSSREAANSYVITQITLSKPGIGVISVCSRYDAHDAFTFIPPGACAGRDGDRMIGVSLSRD